MLILGIDQSYTSTGCVVLEDNKFLYAQKITSDEHLDKPDRAWQIAHDILFLATRCGRNLNCIALEGLAFGMRGNATRDLAGLQFIIIGVLRHEGKYDNIQIVSPLSVKKFATGNGKADKNAMIEKLPKDIGEEFNKLGVKKSTGLKDLADAYWIARVASDPNFKTQTKKVKINNDLLT